MPIGAKKISVLAKNMVGFIRAKIIVVVKCNVFPIVLINRPVIVFSFMTNVFRTWINVFQITTHF